MLRWILFILLVTLCVVAAFWVRSSVATNDPGWIVLYGTKGGLPVILGRIPYCLIFGLVAILIAVLWSYFIKVQQPRERERSGLCWRCGYCLKSSTSDRCPECG